MKTRVALASLFLALASAGAIAQGTAVPDTGICYPEPASAWTEETKELQREAARKLVKDVGEAIARGDKKFVAKPGDYRFGSEDLKNFPITAKDFVLEAKGASFWFNGRIPVDAFALSNCKSFVLRGATVDFDPLPFTQGKILSIDEDGKSFDLSIDPNFPLPDGWKTGGNIKAVFFTPDGATMRRTRLDWIASLEKREDRIYRAKCVNGFMFKYKEDPPAVGDRVVLPDRSMRMAFKVQECENVTLEDVTVYSCPNMVFSEGNGEGGNIYRRCKVILRPGTSRLIASNADIFHSVKVRKGPLIENCEFSRACDDIVNIHSFFSFVLDAKGPRKLLVSSFYRDDVSAGCELSFYDRKTFKPLGSAKILKATSMDDSATVKEAKDVPAKIKALGEKAGDLVSGRVYPCLVELDRDIKVSNLDIFSSSDRIARGAIVRDNYFHDGFARGVIMRAENFAIERNRIERIGTSSIIVFTELYCWEGPSSKNGRISENVIVGSNARLDGLLWNNGFQGAISVWVDGGRQSYSKGALAQESIVIEGNTVISPAATAIFVANAKNSYVLKNRIEKPFSRKLPPEAGQDLGRAAYSIFVADSKGVACEGNSVEEGVSADCKGSIGVENAEDFKCDAKFERLK